MPNFTAPVGLQARNEIHDVALLQGALLILKTHKRLSFWDGPVDGDWRSHQQSLTEALKKLEAEAKINNGPGRIEPGGPLARTLKQLLPPQYQSLSAIQGTACLTIKDPYGSQHKGPALKDLALHDQCRRELEQLMKAGADKLGLSLVIDKEETDHKGRCVFTLKPHGVKCLDARLNPLAPGAPTPKPIRDRLGHLSVSLNQLQLNSSGNDFQLKTRQPVQTKEAVAITARPIQKLTRPFLKGAVGRAANAKEDVALVQTALGNLKGADGQAFWQGGITGTGTQALIEAIKKFEASIGQAPTGKIDPGSNTEAAMVNMLPANRQNMRALPGTAHVYFIQG